LIINLLISRISPKSRTMMLRHKIESWRLAL